VPIYIRAGKGLSVTAAEVMVYFKRPPRETFAEIASSASSPARPSRHLLQPSFLLTRGDRQYADYQSVPGVAQGVAFLARPAGGQNQRRERKHHNHAGNYYLYL
jgi:hypothetical protein